MGGEAEVKDLNPWRDYIQDYLQGALPLPGMAGPIYPGQMRAQPTPMEIMATQLAGRRATQGQPMAWQQALGLLGPNTMANQMGMSLAMEPRDARSTSIAEMMLGQSMGQPVGWDYYRDPSRMLNEAAVQNFIGGYAQGYPVGWNPYSGLQPGDTGVPPWAGGG